MEIFRCIGIDCGHRIPFHNGLCKNLHGHKYEIELYAEAKQVQSDGPSTGMVVDFSFLKSILQENIYCYDHHLFIWERDQKKEFLINEAALFAQVSKRAHFTLGHVTQQYLEEEFIHTDFVSVPGHISPLFITKLVPTVENLAYMWLKKCINCSILPNGVNLSRIRVWETPNSCVEIRADEISTERNNDELQ